jgi:hypothetical protein
MPSASARRKSVVTKADSSVTAIASFYSTLILHLPEFGLKGTVSVCAPVFGYLTFIIWRLMRSNINLVHYEFKTNRYIADLEAEKLRPGLCQEEIKEIEAQIKMYKSATHRRRVDDLNVI